MHEFSICESIFSALEKEYNTLHPRPKVNTVQLVIGEMHQVIEENLRAAWEVVTMDTPFQKSILTITWKPVILFCNDCKKEMPKRGLMFVCAHCSSRNIEIKEGRELYIENMGVDKDE
ncbi:MAG: hydrogenase maturation nickel metallochaperone HypA [Spirochaetales bacterium]|nr:hydrogenase maturation nickel metallochaperone HypA [Spirochaetales bacterium]